MKKTVLFIVFFIILALIIPETSLFADTGGGGRFDLGLNLFAFPSSITTSEVDGFRVIPLVPLIDAGAYGQLNLGLVNLGAGIRGFSIIVINVFWPSVYAEVNLWRFTLNAQIGGGILYVFPLFLAAGPYLVPELSLWYTINASIKGSQLRLGLGAISLLSPQAINDDVFSYFSNNLVFYLGVKATLHSS